MPKPIINENALIELSRKVEQILREKDPRLQISISNAVKMSGTVRIDVELVGKDGKHLMTLASQSVRPGDRVNIDFHQNLILRADIQDGFITMT